MKRILILAMVFGLVNVAFGQEINNRTITIETDKPLQLFEIPVEKGNYSLEIKNPKNFSVSVKRNAVMKEPLKFEKSEIKSAIQLDTLLISTEIIPMIFEKNTEYVITITADTDPKERVYKFKSQSNWSWTTSFGANSIIFSNRSKFVSNENGGITTVSSIQDRKVMELMPTAMFTFMNNHQDVSFGFTGGLGLNLEELAIFSGISIAIGQNIMLTGGIAVHQQQRPNSDFFVGQTIDSAISSDVLNKDYYRANPFIGISYRFNKNPFGIASE